MQKKHKLITAGLGAGALALGVSLTGGTSAYFYDDEAQAASISAGTIDLVTSGAVTGNGLNPRANVTYDSVTKKLSASNLQPGDSFTYTVDFTNAGTLDAFPYMDWKVSNDSENGVIEAEGANDPSAAGELDDIMQVKFDIDAWGVAGPQSLRSYEIPAARGLSWAMTPGMTRQARFTFTVPNGGQGVENAVMTDSFDLTIKFALTQNTGAQVPTL